MDDCHYCSNVLVVCKPINNHCYLFNNPPPTYTHTIDPFHVLRPGQIDYLFLGFLSSNSDIKISQKPRCLKVRCIGMYLVLLSPLLSCLCTFWPYHPYLPLTCTCCVPPPPLLIILMYQWCVSQKRNNHCCLFANPLHPPRPPLLPSSLTQFVLFMH